MLRRKVGGDAGEIREALELIDGISTAVDPTGVRTGIAGICRDPDDDSVLACAVSTGADYLVSRDRDLLVLGNCRGVKIVTPRTFELLLKD